MALKRRGSLRGAAGGLDRYDAADGDEYGVGLFAEHDGLVGGPAVGQKDPQRVGTRKVLEGDSVAQRPPTLGIGPRARQGSARIR